MLANDVNAFVQAFDFYLLLFLQFQVISWNLATEIKCLLLFLRYSPAWVIY